MPKFTTGISRNDRSRVPKTEHGNVLSQNDTPLKFTLEYHNSIRDAISSIDHYAATNDRRADASDRRSEAMEARIEQAVLRIDILEKQSSRWLGIGAGFGMVGGLLVVVWNFAASVMGLLKHK